MGYVMSADETGDPELHIEIRRESLYLTDDYNPWRLPEEPAGVQHVWVYGGGMDTIPGVKDPQNASGTVEVTKVWLAKLYKFLSDPKNRERVGIEGIE